MGGAEASGKVFVDHNMNRVGANISARWSLRPEPGATVSTPVTWDEVDDGDIRAERLHDQTIWRRHRAGRATRSARSLTARRRT